MGIGVRNFPLWLRAVDRVQRALTPVPWPARLAEWIGAWPPVTVERHDLQVAAMPPACGGLRLVYASDFHAGPMTPASTIEGALDAVEGERPDVLLLGGDFVSLRPADGEALIRRLGRIEAPLGRYAVLGNHDHHAGAPALASLLDEAGIQVLTNRSITLLEGVTLTGLDDHWSGEPDADAAFAGAGGARVVVMHAPSGLLDIGDRSFAVALCGHTHGGQIVLKPGRPIIVPHGPLSRRYPAGRYDLDGGRVLLVSPGIGCTGLPFRVNAPPSITVCTLRPAIATATPSSPLP